MWSVEDVGSITHSVGSRDYWASEAHSVGSWDYWAPGQLGLGTPGHQNKMAWVGGRDVFKEPVVLVAAGWTHAACMTSKGVFYTCGNGKHGDGFQEIRLNPQCI